MAETESSGGAAEYDDETKKRLADTNMENYGGKEHRDKQKGIADKQPEWDGCGQEVGIEVWRINKFKVEKCTTEDHNESFYNGDSYIVLNTYKPDPAKEKLLYNAHFWLGKNTSQDEAGAAAIKTVELDDKLGDLPVQYREVEGVESKLFMDMFGNFKTLEGGHDSGFRKVEKKKWAIRLLVCKAKKKKKKRFVELREVPNVLGSLNNNDVFILDLGTKMVVLNTPNADRWERRKANEYLQEVIAERNGRLDKAFIDFGDTDAEAQQFFENLGCDSIPDSLPDTAEWQDEKKKREERLAAFENLIFHVTDENGEMEFNERQRGVLNRDILKEEDDDVLIVDVGRIIYVWLGSTCNKEEIKFAMKKAQDYCFGAGRGMDTTIVRIFSGREPENFWKCFGVEHVPAGLC